MPYTDYPNPSAKLNHRIENVELSHVAAIAEDTLRNRAREYGELAMDQQNEHDDVAEMSDVFFEMSQQARKDAERIGHMILAREIPERY